MKKEKIVVRQLVEKYQTNCARISEIVDVMEREKRDRTEAEEVEYASLVRENQLLQMKSQAASAEYLKDNPNAREEAEKIIRENAARGQKTEITFVRDVMMVSDVTNGGVIPLNVQDILEPLTEGFILDKVGLPMPTGLVGDFVWPIYEMVEATVLGEGAELSDTKIPFSKLTATPARVGIAIPATYQSLNQTSGLLEMIIKKIMPQAIKQLLNKIVFSTSAVNPAANSAGLVGPFVAAKGTAVALSSIPTYKQLNAQMKAKMLESGVEGENMCWVMTKSMQAVLEGTPINSSGIHVPMVQNGMLCGLPIYTTNAIRETTKAYKKRGASSWSDYTLQDNDTVKYSVSGDTEAHALAAITSPAADEIAEVSVVTEFIGLGDWRYQPMGMFGTLRFIVDPYSKARRDTVDFVLNADYATKTLRKEAFILGKVAPSS